MPLAHNLRDARKRASLTLEELARAAEISKTYLWELENDEDGVKKPSGEILLRIANALSLTVAELLGMPTVQVDGAKLELTRSLIEFRDWMEKIGQPICDEDFRDLAAMRFRGGQPRTKEDWFDLYRTLKRISEQ
jgi:transcriptional regulator with XRE-family HTH domain